MTVKYLEMVQAIIGRMASNSFVVKGWSLTITGAILAFATSSENGWSGAIALIPCLAFWRLDAHYLRQERLYRCLFDRIRKTWGDTECSPSDFDLSTESVVRAGPSVWNVMRSPTLVWFHLPIAVAVCAVAAMLMA